MRASSSLDYTTFMRESSVGNRERWVDILELPEFHVGLFSFLLNFVWEMQQMPFFAIPPEFTIFDVIKGCTQATLGDVGISVTAFWAVAVVAKSRQWIRRPTWRQVVGFILVGVLITIVFEAMATGPLGRWAYADEMVTLPILGTGLVPTLQWIILPPMVVWFVKRQVLASV